MAIQLLIILFICQVPSGSPNTRLYITSYQRTISKEYYTNEQCPPTNNTRRNLVTRKIAHYRKESGWFLYFYGLSLLRWKEHNEINGESAETTTTSSQQTWAMSRDSCQLRSWKYLRNCCSAVGPAVVQK